MDYGTRQVGWSANPPVGQSVTSGAALNADLFSLDVSQFRSVSAQLTGTWVGTVAWQGSNDNVNWVAVSAPSVGATGSPFVTSASANGMWLIPVSFRFLRLRLTAYTSGTVFADAFAYYDDRTIGQISGSIPLSSAASILQVPSATAGGFNTTHHLVSAATTNATSVKASGGTIGLIAVSNKNAAPVYFKLYNKASAPTVGTDTPVMTILVPTNSTVTVPHPTGLRLATGIAFALTTGLAVADTGAVTAGDVVTHISYV